MSETSSSFGIILIPSGGCLIKSANSLDTFRITFGAKFSTFEVYVFYNGELSYHELNDPKKTYRHNFDYFIRLISNNKDLMRFNLLQMVKKVETKLG